MLKIMFGLKYNRRVIWKVVRFYDTIHNQLLLRKYSSQNFAVSDPRVQKYLAYLENEYKTLQKQVQNPSEHCNVKRLSELQPIINILQARHSIFDNLASLKEISPDDSKDQELSSLIEKEQQSYKHKLENLDLELIEALLPEDHFDYCSDLVLEVTAGVGGQEAMLFARELFDMYCGYAVFKHWNTEIAQMEQSEMGGLRHASVFISGDKVFQHLKHEAGVHRVQRIPLTERSGRVHTSTVTVAVLPQPEEVEVVLKDKDLKIETKKSSGAGGQHVNTTESAVRIVHIPTGIAIECQTDRSQIKNKQIALQRLRAEVFQRQIDHQRAEINASRKQQVGSSMRSEKIRTYNFNQDRITDHRVSGNVHNLRGFLSGNQLLDALVQDLHQTARKQMLMQTISELQGHVPKT